MFFSCKENSIDILRILGVIFPLLVVQGNTDLNRVLKVLKDANLVIELECLMLFIGGEILIIFEDIGIHLIVEWDPEEVLDDVFLGKF